MAFLLAGLISSMLSVPNANAAGNADQINSIPLTVDARQWALSLRWENDTPGGQTIPGLGLPVEKRAHPESGL
jgi:hypothetical protein